MTPFHLFPLPGSMSRRNWLRSASASFGYLALAGMAASRAAAESGAVAPHFAPRAKRVVFLYMRGGPYDFSCATCHGVTGQRIRLQDLPNISSNKPDADRAFTTWPAYRVSQGALRSMQWRLYDCFRQQRWPELVFLSPTSIDLITFLGVNANGAKMDAPAIKR